MDKTERLDDLVHVTSTAFLGLTLRCARCHDHKFDPIPQRDYYAMAGNPKASLDHPSARVAGYRSTQPSLCRKMA